MIRGLYKLELDSRYRWRAYFLDSKRDNRQPGLGRSFLRSKPLGESLPDAVASLNRLTLVDLQPGREIVGCGECDR